MESDQKQGKKKSLPNEMSVLRNRDVYLENIKDRMLLLRSPVKRLLEGPLWTRSLPMCNSAPRTPVPAGAARVQGD